MDQSSPRLGYCCVYLPPDRDPAVKKRMNMAGTTVTALSRLSRAAAFEKVLGLVAHNLAALRLQIEDVARRPPLERLLRIMSQLLPAYTHDVGRWMYREPALRQRIETGLAEAGRMAREAGVRLSIQPGQFCVLATGSGAALQNAIAELEYHADVMRWMGYAGEWHPYGAHINIHAGARSAGLDAFRAGFRRLSRDACDLVTVENDEVAFGLDDLLPLADSLPIVLDLHHHWISSGGEYIQPDDPRIEVVQRSWRGVRPVSHISVSREDLLVGHPPHVLPDFAALASRGLKLRDLRAHSDDMWNNAMNDWVRAHLVWTDFEVEAKLKNLASQRLAEHIVQAGGCPPLASTLPQNA